VSLKKPLRSKLASSVSRSAAALSRATGRGDGAVIGGKIGLMIDPNLLANLASGRKIALISGTNGKTTTTRLTTAAMGVLGDVATNSFGANMPTGHTSALARAGDTPYAVLEVDEHYMPQVVKSTRPHVVALLNLSRDQLDRAKEVAMIADLWRTTLTRYPVHVVANADDPMITWAANAAVAAGAGVTWVAAGQRWHDDSWVCPACGAHIERGPEKQAGSVEGTALGDSTMLMSTVRGEDADRTTVLPAGGARPGVLPAGGTGSGVLPGGGGIDRDGPTEVLGRGAGASTDDNTTVVLRPGQSPVPGGSTGTPADGDEKTSVLSFGTPASGTSAATPPSGASGTGPRQSVLGGSGAGPGSPWPPMPQRDVTGDAPTVPVTPETAGGSDVTVPFTKPAPSGPGATAAHTSVPAKDTGANALTGGTGPIGESTSAMAAPGWDDDEDEHEVDVDRVVAEWSAENTPKRVRVAAPPTPPGPTGGYGPPGFMTEPADADLAELAGLRPSGGIGPEAPTKAIGLPSAGLYGGSAPQSTPVPAAPPVGTAAEAVADAERDSGIAGDDDWHCTNCDLHRPVPTWFVDDDCVVDPAGRRHVVRLQLPGRVNRANAATALAVAAEFGVDPAIAAPRLSGVASIAGRYAQVDRDGRNIRLLLAKNPAGWLEAFDMAEDAPTLLAINSRDPDGLDTSWLFDVDFSPLAGRQVLISGERAFDLAVRLEVNDIEFRHVRTFGEAVDAVPPGRLEVIANYTAFQDIRAELDRVN
jgi:UDP-N-acetylmuramyl tripeptide synthase